MDQSPIHTQEKPALYLQKMQVLGTVYERYAKEVCRYFCSYTHDMMAAEDMTHDLFLRLANVDFISEKTARSLLFITASRMIVDDVRHKAYVRKYERDCLLDMENQDTFSVERKMDNEQMARLISMRLDKMASRCADVYKLYFREGKHTKEIAQELNIGVRTVEFYIYNSRKQVKDYLLNVFNL